MRNPSSKNTKSKTSKHIALEMLSSDDPNERLVGAKILTLSLPPAWMAAPPEPTRELIHGINERVIGWYLEF